MELLKSSARGNFLVGQLLIPLLLAITVVSGEAQNAGNADIGFHPRPNSYASTVAVQPDGKILVAGMFTRIDVVTRNRIARINPDGTLDPVFDPDVNDRVHCLAVQEDGKILLGGRFTSIGGQTRNHIARLNADGSVDATFDPDANDWVDSLVVQADGKILVGGVFDAIGGQTRNNLARLNTDGSLDTAFDPNVERSVHALAVTPDGKIYVAGGFFTIGGQSHKDLARLNADGSVDNTFNAAVDNSGTVTAIALQPDGKLLAGGSFHNIGGLDRNRFARLNGDGSADPAFDPDVSGSVETMALQTDGKILIGGRFATVGGQPPRELARVNPDGSLDPSFDSDSGGFIDTLALQADGKLLVTGSFLSIGGQNRLSLARLINEEAYQHLAAGEDGSALTWSRGGSSPEVNRVTFERSTNGGTTWSPLGAGSRIGNTSNWRLTGLALPTVQNPLIRARGMQMSNSAVYGSASIYETVRRIYFFRSPPPVLINEVDAISQAGDTREFIELYDGGLGNTGLDVLVLVLFDGSGDTSYTVIDLDGRSTDANGYFVIGSAGTPNVDLVIPDGALQNGADAVALFVGEAADFPNGTAVTADDLMDAVVYDSGQADDSGLLALLNAAEPQLNEDEHGNATGHSLQRLPNGSGGNRNTSGFLMRSPTPGEENTPTPVPGVPDLTESSDTGDSATDNLTRQSMPTFAGTTLPGAQVSVSSSVTGGVVGTGVADSSGNWSVTVSTALADGTHEITASADGSAASSALTITIDTMAPSAPADLDLTAGSDSGTSNSDDATNDNSPTIEGTAEDAATLKVFAGGVLQGLATGAGGTPWSFTIPAGMQLADGSHTITAKATDAAGNESAVSGGLVVTIDTLAPPAPSGLDLIAASDLGTSNDDDITSDNSPTIAGGAENGAAISIKVGGAAMVSGSSNGSFSITLPSQSDGVKSITATATDVAGNMSGVAGPLLITIDTVAPAAPTGLDLATASDSGSSSTDNITRDNTPTIAGGAESGVAISIRVWGTAVVSGSSNGSFSISLPAESDGVKSITATAMDVAGNTSGVGGPLLITIDTGVPAAPIALDLTAGSDLGTSNTDDITSDNTPSFTGQAEAGGSVTLYADGNPIGTGFSNSSWTITPSSVLGDGTHQLTAKTADSAGNESIVSAPLTVTIETVAPTVAINQAGAQADPAPGAPVNFTVVFSENVGGFVAGDVTFVGAAGPLNPQLSGSGANYTATVGAVSGEGPVTASIGAGVVTDIAGNANEASTSTDASVVIDHHGGTANVATEVALIGGTGTVSGWLEDGDTDVFSFTIGDPKHVEIKTTGNVDTMGRLRNAAGDLLNDPNGDDDRGGDGNFRINKLLLAESYTVEVNSKGAIQRGAYQLEITFGAMVSYQPDIHVGVSAARTIGDGIYGTGSGQTLILTSKRARTVRGITTIENDGELPEDFQIRSNSGNNLFKVTYSTESGNVTAAIVSGTYRTGEMNPGDPAHVVKLRVKPNKRKIVKNVGRGGRRRMIVKKKRITLNFRSVSETDKITADTGFFKVRTK